MRRPVLCPSPKTIAGIASAVILFVAVVATTICCFLCSCCYLYRRRQQLQSPFEGASVRLSTQEGAECPQRASEVRRCGWQLQAPLDTPACPSPQKPERRDTCEPSAHGCTGTVCRACACGSQETHGPGLERERHRVHSMCKRRVPAHRPRPGVCGNSDPVSGSVREDFSGAALLGRGSHILA